MDDDLDIQMKRIKELPLRLTFDWAVHSASILAKTLDQLGYFNAGATADQISTDLQALAKEVMG